MCWSFNHQNIMAHFPFSLPLFDDSCQHIKKQQGKCNINANEDQILFTYDLAYLDHSLSPLGLFLQTKFFFLSLSQTHLFEQIERYFKSKTYQLPKTLPFSHNQNSPPQETKFRNKSILTKTNF